MGIVAVLSMSLGTIAPALAVSHENATMTMDNVTSGMDNATDNQTFTPVSELPNENTTNMLNGTERGLDANIIE